MLLRFLRLYLRNRRSSRVLIEAIASGCYPRTIAETPTTSEVLNKLKYGSIFETDSKLDLEKRTVKFDIKKATKIIDLIAKSSPSKSTTINSSLLKNPNFNETLEIKELSNILIS